MNETESKIPEQPRDSAGQDFIKKIGPAGCALFLGLLVLVTAICFTAKPDPVPGYEPPYDTAYWQSHPEALAEELNENILPALELESVASVENGTVTVTVEGDNPNPVRAVVIRYFDKDLFVFTTD